VTAGRRPALAALLLLAACPKAASPTARGAVDGFAAEVVALANRDRWDELLARAEPSHRDVQLDRMGMGVDQYLAELFGLHTVGNSIDPAGDGLDAADLRRVGTFVVHGTRANGSLVEVFGAVEVEGQGTLSFTFTVIATPDGYRLTGDVG
jgi:hypothetical protein